jgi:hypothetical protein
MISTIHHAFAAAARPSTADTFSWKWALKAGAVAALVSPQFAAATYCLSSEIISGKVNSCTCRPTGQYNQGTQICPDVKYKLAKCEACTTNNADVDPCYIYYQEVCECIKDAASGGSSCQFSTSWAGGTTPPPDWVYRPSKDALIMPKVPNTGIENADALPSPDGGWQFGIAQFLSKAPGSTALVINSPLVRDQNQYHIHVCPKETKVSKTLTLYNRKAFQAYQPIPCTDWYCMAITASVSSLTSRTIAFIATRPASDRKTIGQGVIADDNNELWSCLSVTPKVAKAIFCG